jgi:hypothetical protein
MIPTTDSQKEGMLGVRIKKLRSLASPMSCMHVSTAVFAFDGAAAWSVIGVGQE